jgi:hypothetical protein
MANLARRAKTVLIVALAFAVALSSLEALWCIGRCSGNFAHWGTYVFFMVAFASAIIVGSALVAVLGIPGLLALRRFGLDQPFEICVLSSVVALVPPLIVWSLTPEDQPPIAQLLIFAAAGLVAGVAAVGKRYVVQFKN